MFGIFKKKKKQEKKEKETKAKKTAKPKEKPVKEKAKKENPQKQKKDGVLFVTNSTVLPDVKVPGYAIGDNKGLFMIGFAAELSSCLKKSEGFKLSHLAYSVLGEKGVLEIPVEVAHKDKKIAVLIYEKAGKEAAKQFNAAKKFLKEKYKMDACYYAPKKLDPKAPAGNPFRIMNEKLDLFPKPKENLKGNYAMWFAAKKDEKFIGSKCHKHMKRAYKAMEGIETYILCAIGKALEFYKGEHFRLRVPEDMIRMPLKGPESRMMLFTACTEKGLAFKFDVKNTPASYRDLFWKAFADYVENIKKVLVEKKADLDDECCSAKWFNTIEKYLQSKKDNTDMLGISMMS